MFDAMEKIHERLKLARIKAGYPYPTHASRDFGWSEKTYYNHETGRSGIKLKDVIKYAKAFNIDQKWLLTGKGNLEFLQRAKPTKSFPRENYKTFNDREEKPYQRLQMARSKSGYVSAADAARAFKWSEQTYSCHERGARGLTLNAAEKYALAFNVSAAWLLTGEVSSERKNSLHIKGLIGDGGIIDTYFEQETAIYLDGLISSFPIPQDAFAFEVTGESMLPRYENGDIVICWNKSEEPSSLLGCEAAVLTDDGIRYLKRIKCGDKEGKFHLESYNQEISTIKNVRISWCSEVRAVIRRGCFYKGKK